MRCINCDFVFTQLQPKEESINTKIYDDSYASNYESRKYQIKNRFSEKLKLIEDYKSGDNLLDIGCSVGYFLQTIEENSKYSWWLFGAEINKSLIENAKKNTRATISWCGLPKLSFTDKKFDVVTCFDVLEHSAFIRSNLKEISRVLKDDGILVLQCPNYSSLMQMLTRDKWDWWTPPDHVIHFSKRSLVKALNDNGFEPKYIKTYEYTNDYLSNIRGARFRKGLKPLFYLLVPIFVFFEKIAGWVGYGGLVLIVAAKK